MKKVNANVDSKVSKYTSYIYICVSEDNISIIIENTEKTSII